MTSAWMHSTGRLNARALRHRAGGQRLAMLAQAIVG
jgi:hypothetical protein